MFAWLRSIFIRPVQPSLTPNYQVGVTGGLRTCRYCLNFGGFDRDDPHDHSGKCDLKYDPANEYGSPWISEDMTCDAWERDSD